jgi:rhamnose transport system substrate-binding protein
MGIEGKVVGPSEAGASAQVPYINTAITQHQNAILIAANGPNALVPYLKKALGQNITVVTLDSDTAPEGRNLFINQASAEGIGQSLVQTLAKQIGSSGDFAILSATPNATNQNTWIKYMQEELKKPEYKDMKLVRIAYGNDDDQKSFTETQGLLQAYPNLKGIISPGAERAAKLILVYYVPPKRCQAGIPPWAPKQKQSSLAPGFSRSPSLQTPKGPITRAKL